MDKPFYHLGRHLARLLAPAVVQVWPEVYHDSYIQALVQYTESVPSLNGLADGHVRQDYLPLTLTPLEEADSTETIWQAIMRAPHILIHGCVGSGKSALLRALAWRIADNPNAGQIRSVTFKHFEKPTEALMPVIVDLHRFQSARPDLLAAMADSLSALDFPSGRGYLRHLLEAGQCIVLLDGYDALTEEAHQHEIAQFIKTYPNILTVITTRPNHKAYNLVGHCAYNLQGMENAQTTLYVRRCLSECPGSVSGILAACERSQSLAKLASLPLMAAAMCVALQAPGRQQPLLSELCDACVETLLGDWNRSQTWSGEQERRELQHLLQVLALGCLQTDRRNMDRSSAIAQIKAHLAPQRQQAADELLEAMTRHTGILCADPDAPDHYRFFSPILQSYLAAHEIINTKQTDLLVDHADDDAWSDAIVLTSSLMSDSLPLLRRMQQLPLPKLDLTYLLAHCLAESQNPDPALVEQVETSLYALIEQQDGTHWETAAVAIAGIARTPSSEYFGNLVHDGHAEASVRQRAALMLGRLARPATIPSLTAAITDADANVARQAVWALGQIPSGQAVHALPRALRYPDGAVRQEATRALAHLGSHPDLTKLAVTNLIAALEVTQGDDDNALYAEEALLEIGPVATSTLIAALQNRQTRAQHRSRIARVLGCMGDPRALPILIDNLLSESSQNAESHIEAIASVGAEAVPTLIQTLNHSDITQSSRIVAALARIGNAAIEPLIAAVGGSQPEVRNAAVRALEQIGTPATDALIQTLLHDTNPQVRRSVLGVLRTIGDHRVVEALISSLEDPDEGVQSNALYYLGTLQDTSAVPSLIRFAETTEDPRQLRLVLTSLGSLQDERSLPLLISWLADPNLGQAASSALRAMGAQAVPMLIALLHGRDTDPEQRRAIWPILDYIGSSPRASQPTMEALAAAYARLSDETLDREDILKITQPLDWWEHGREIHESLATAATLTEANDLEQISRCEDDLVWIDGIVEWLRPQIRDILRELLNIVQSTELFYSLSLQESERDALMQSRDALLTAIDRLNDTRRIVQDTLLPFERKFFDQLITQWHMLIHSAVRRLRGQARLDIVLSTPSITIRDSQMISQVVFRVFNRGDSAARNITIQVRSADVLGPKVRVVHPEPISLRPLGIGDQRQVEVPIAAEGAMHAALALEIRYDDDERHGVTEPFSCHIEFVQSSGEYQRIRRSPYIVGMPVKTEHMFFGRQDVFEWVRENICNTSQQQPLLMFGERRMGKTSVLYQLLQNPPTPDHFCVLFDLQLYSYVETVADLLYQLSQCIRSSASAVGVTLPEYDRTAFEPDGYATFTQLVDSLEGAFQEKRMVIMMDEFGILLDKVRQGVFKTSLFDYLRGITQRTNCFTFIFTGSYEIRRMQQDFDSILFNMPKVFRITYLSEIEAERLITEPMQGLLQFHPLVIQRILAVTACHPYFVQYICGELVRLARNERRNYVELTDLEYVTRSVVQDATGNIENSIYIRLSPDEKLVLAATAEVADDVHMYVPLSDIAALLDRRGLTLSRERIIGALHALQERDLITEMRIGQQLRYAFKMGLIRMWLKQKEILLRLIQEREV